MTTTHNHPPICCCISDATTRTDTHCPGCPHHGEFTQHGNPQPGECPICHSEIGKQHTDYCRFTGPVSTALVNALEHRSQVSQPATHTSQPKTQARACTSPVSNHGDGRGCQDETCPRHADPSIDGCPPELPQLVCRRCNGYGLLGVAAGVNPVPCPDCTLPAREPS